MGDEILGESALTVLELLPFKPYRAVLVTYYCTLHTASVSAERVGQGEVGEATHCVLCTCRLSCKRAMIDTAWANAHPGCMHELA